MNRWNASFSFTQQAHPPITTNSTQSGLRRHQIFHTTFIQSSPRYFLRFCLCTKLFFFAQRHLKTFLSKRWKSYILHFSGNCRLITLPVLLFPQLFVLKLMLLFFLSVDPFLFACFLGFPNTPSKTPLWDSSVMETEKSL